MGRPMQNQSAQIAQSQLILWNLEILSWSSEKKNVGPKFVNNNIWLRLYEQQSEYFKETKRTR